jgi:hypothetical protein
MVLAAPGLLLTPPPSSSPPKTPHRSYSAQTRSQHEEKPVMMLDSPHTSAPMLMRGTSLPQRAFHPTDHVQQDIHPTDNPPPSPQKSGAGEARRRVGRRRERPPSSDCQNLRALVMQSSAPAPGAPSPWDKLKWQPSVRRFVRDS